MSGCDGLESGPCPHSPDSSSIVRRGDLRLCPNCLSGRFPEDTAPSQLRTLSELVVKQTEPDFVASFMVSLGFIFQYAQGDIKASLTQIDQAVLMDIRSRLCAACCDLFAQYLDKKSINRQAKHKVVEDVLSLGVSVVNKLPGKDLDKIFKYVNCDVTDTPKSAQPSDDGLGDVEDVSELIKQVVDNRERIRKLERLVNSLSALVSKLGGSVPGGAPDPVTGAGSSGDTDNDRRASQISQLPHTGEDSDETEGLVGGDQASGSDDSSESDCDTDVEITDTPNTGDNGFTVPARVRKAAARKQRRKEKREQEKALEELLAQERQAAGVRVVKAAATPRMDTKSVYIGGVNLSNNVKDIKQHIVSLGVSSVRGIKQLSQNSQSRSFKVDVPHGDFDCVCSSENWPSGVSVRPFRAHKKPRNMEYRPIAGAWERRGRNPRRNGQYRRSDTRRSFRRDYSYGRRREDEQWKDYGYENDSMWYEQQYGRDDYGYTQQADGWRQWEARSPVRGPGGPWAHGWE